MQNWLWIPLGLASALFAALVAIFGKLGLKNIDTTLATTIRAAVMFVMLVAFGGMTGRLTGFGDISSREWLLFVLAGASGAASWLFYFWALKMGKVSQVTPLDRLSLVFAVGLAALFLGEAVGWKTGIGVGLMSIGAILVALA